MTWRDLRPDARGWARIRSWAPALTWATPRGRLGDGGAHAVCPVGPQGRPAAAASGPPSAHSGKKECGKGRQREGEAREGEKPPKTLRCGAGEGDRLPAQPRAPLWLLQASAWSRIFGSRPLRTRVPAESARSAAPAPRSRACRPPLRPRPAHRLPLTTSGCGVGDVGVGAGLPALRPEVSGPSPRRGSRVTGRRLVSWLHVGYGLAAHPGEVPSAGKERRRRALPPELPRVPPIPPGWEPRRSRPSGCSSSPACAVSAGRHLSRRGGLDPHPAYGTVSLSPNAPARRAEWVPWLQLWRCPPVASAARTPVTKFPVRTLQGQCVSLVRNLFVRDAVSSVFWNIRFFLTTDPWILAYFSCKVIGAGVRTKAVRRLCYELNSWWSFLMHSSVVLAWPV